MSLAILLAGELRDILRGLHPFTGPFLGRDLRTGTERLRLSGTGGSGVPGVVGVGPGPPPGGFAPSASYQWLLFETVDGGGAPAEELFTFTGPTIPFVGAVTEVDVISSDPGTAWQMRISISGQGPIFRTSQSADILIDQGWFRPTPPGFWPETEGLVFPLPSPGSSPVVEVRRVGRSLNNLTLRVLVVAHPSF